MGWREREEALLSKQRVLVVGAGGVGCELLKNLVLTGFNNIHVVSESGNYYMTTPIVRDVGERRKVGRNSVGKIGLVISSNGSCHMFLPEFQP